MQGCYAAGACVVKVGDVMQERLQCTTVSRLGTDCDYCAYREAVNKVTNVTIKHHEAPKNAQLF